MLKPGQRIRLLREKGEGVVQEIISKHKVLVLIDDFLELELHVDEIIPVDFKEEVLQSPSLKSTDKAASLSLQNKAINIKLLSEHQYPHLELENDTSAAYFTALFLKIKHKYLPLGTQKILKGQQLPLSLSHKEHLDLAASVFIQYYKIPDDTLRHLPQLKLVELSMQLLKQETKVNILEPSIWEAKNQIAEKAAASFYTLADTEEIDLHLGETYTMAPGALLDMQLHSFDRAIEDAWATGKKRLICIHGVGSGKLKEALVQRLKKLDFIHSWKNADTIRYGNGALEVKLKD